MPALERADNKAGWLLRTAGRGPVAIAPDVIQWSRLHLQV